MIVPRDGSRPAAATVRSFHSADGHLLYYRAWEVESARAVVRIVHGLGEHGGRYAPLAETLRERGIASYALDLRGHGVSEGIRGHVTSFERFLDDMEAFARETPTEAPTFLLGHSLGGLIALRAAETGRAGRLAGAILSAPAVALAKRASVWTHAGASVLSRIAPAVGLSNGIDPADLSRDPEAVAAYRSDPLIHDRITPRLYIEMLAAMRAASEAAAEVRLPVLLLAPGDDRITSVPAAQAVASSFAGAVEIRSYAGYFHESLNERECETVLADIVAWLEKRIA